MSTCKSVSICMSICSITYMSKCILILGYRLRLICICLHVDLYVYLYVYIEAYVYLYVSFGLSLCLYLSPYVYLYTTNFPPANNDLSRLLTRNYLHGISLYVWNMHARRTLHNMHTPTPTTTNLHTYIHTIAPTHSHAHLLIQRYRHAYIHTYTHTHSCINAHPYACTDTRMLNRDLYDRKLF